MIGSTVDEVKAVMHQDFLLEEEEDLLWANESLPLASPLQSFPVRNEDIAIVCSFTVGLYSLVLGRFSVVSW